MRMSAVIVAGGRSSRMGQEKAFTLIRGQSLLDRIVACLDPQAEEVVLNANGDPSRFAPLQLTVVADVRGGICTPLAGLLTALAHAAEKGCDAVLTVPSDTPFLPADLASRLAAASNESAIAASAGQPHYLTGLWRISLLPMLQRALEERQTPRLQDWVQLCHAQVVEWPSQPYDPFFNVNTPEELAEAERIAAEFQL